MANYDLTAATFSLKELITDQVVQNLFYAEHPTLAMIRKYTKFGGKYMPVPIVIGASQGISSSFSIAQGNQSAVQGAEFMLTRKRKYSIATLDVETMLASESDAMAFLNGANTVIQGALRGAGRALSADLFRSGTGSLAQVSTGTAISTGVITLQNPQDIVQFELNMTLQAASSDGGTPRSALGYVIAVDRTAGTLTVSSTAQGGAAGTPTSWTTSDYLLRYGDSNATISGILGWLPTTAPTSGSNFYGVDRSADPVRLAGVRYDGSSQSVEEALIDGSMLTAREGGRPGQAAMNYTSFSGLEKALGAKVQYVDAEGPANIAFRGIRVNGANNTIQVFPDMDCPAARCFLLQMDTWRLDSLKEAPHISTFGAAGDWLRVTNQDAAELRVAFYGNVENSAPGWSANITLGV